MFKIIIKSSIYRFLFIKNQKYSGCSFYLYAYFDMKIGTELRKKSKEQGKEKVSDLEL